jgi:hypothetical protein
MAKGLSARAPNSGLQEPPPVQIQEEPHPRQSKAPLEQMHSALGRCRQLGDIEIYSGVARASERGLRRDLAVPLSAIPLGYSNPVTCAMHGQAYLAETAVGRSLNAADRVKIVCERQDRIDEMIARAHSTPTSD